MGDTQRSLISKKSMSPLSCNRCRKQFPSVEERISHAQLKHNVLKAAHPCTDCKIAGFSSKSKLKKHKQTKCFGQDWGIHLQNVNNLQIGSGSNTGESNGNNQISVPAKSSPPKPLQSRRGRKRSSKPTTTDENVSEPKKPHDSLMCSGTTSVKVRDIESKAPIKPSFLTEEHCQNPPSEVSSSHESFALSVRMSTRRRTVSSSEQKRTKDVANPKSVTVPNTCTKVAKQDSKSEKTELPHESDILVTNASKNLRSRRNSESCKKKLASNFQNTEGKSRGRAVKSLDSSFNLFDSKTLSKTNPSESPIKSPLTGRRTRRSLNISKQDLSDASQNPIISPQLVDKLFTTNKVENSVVRRITQNRLCKKIPSEDILGSQKINSDVNLRVIDKESTTEKNNAPPKVLPKLVASEVSIPKVLSTCESPPIVTTMTLLKAEDQSDQLKSKRRKVSQDQVYSPPRRSKRLKLDDLAVLTPLQTLAMVADMDQKCSIEEKSNMTSSVVAKPLELNSQVLSQTDSLEIDGAFIKSSAKQTDGRKTIDTESPIIEASKIKQKNSLTISEDKEKISKNLDNELKSVHHGSTGIDLQGSNSRSLELSPKSVETGAVCTTFGTGVSVTETVMIPASVKVALLDWDSFIATNPRKTRSSSVVTSNQSCQMPPRHQSQPNSTTKTAKGSFSSVTENQCSPQIQRSTVSEDCGTAICNMQVTGDANLDPISDGSTKRSVASSAASRCSRKVTTRKDLLLSNSDKKTIKTKVSRSSTNSSIQNLDRNNVDTDSDATTPAVYVNTDLPISYVKINHLSPKYQHLCDSSQEVKEKEDFDELRQMAKEEELEKSKELEISREEEDDSEVDQSTSLKRRTVEHSKMLSCPSCHLAGFTSMAELKVHQSLSCPGQEKNSSRKTKSSSVWYCPGCTTAQGPFESAEALLSHLPKCLNGKTNGGRKQRGGKTKNLDRLSTPLVLPVCPSPLCGPTTTFGCAICGVMVASESRLDKHRRDEHGY